VGHPVWAEVDLSALAHNLREVRQLVGERKVMAVVKANAYGHGMIPVARTLLAAGADWLGVLVLWRHWISGKKRLPRRFWFWGTLTL